MSLANALQSLRAHEIIPRFGRITQCATENDTTTQRPRAVVFGPEMAQEMETEVERLRGEVVRLQQRVLAQQMELDNLKNQSGPADHAHERGSNNVDDLGGADLLWRACPPLKCSVVRPHLVTLGDTIYVGGGNTPNQEMCRRVHKLVPGADKWESLPITPYLTFALAGVNGHPTVNGSATSSSAL